MPKFSIEVRFKGGLSQTQQAAFSKAAARWKEVIVGDIPPFKVHGEILSALVIEAKGIRIDGAGTREGNTLGQSQPTVFLPNGLPIKGEMEFDTFDLGDMEEDGTETQGLICQSRQVQASQSPGVESDGCRRLTRARATLHPQQSEPQEDRADVSARIRGRLATS